MIHRTAIVALLPLSLAACGSASDETRAVANNAAGGDYLARIEQLNEKERNAVLFRAISDAGRACQGVARSASAPAVQGNPAWVATCEDGTPWVVSINNTGTATVIPVAATTKSG